MKKPTSLANRLREVFLNGKWIANTNYKEQLQFTSWELAVVKFNNLNSIAELTFHINYYLKGILDAIDNGKLEIQDKYSFDLPSINSQTEWNALINNLFDNADQLANYIDNIDDQKLNDFFFDEKYGTYERNIEAILEHSYYHLGQIVLLNKLHQ